MPSRRLPSRPRPWLTTAALAAAIVVHLLLLAHLAWPREPVKRLFNDEYNRPGPGADFFAVYHSGRQALTGRNPYAPDEQPRVTPEFAPFRYPPGVAYTIGVGFAWAKPWMAYTAWIVILEALLVLDLLLLRRLIDDPRTRTLTAAGWLVFTPLHLELWMGQFTFATASLVFIAAILWRDASKRARRLAAGLWAVAVAVKLYPLALVPHLVRERRYGAIAAGMALLAAALAWLAWNPADAEYFWRLNVTESDPGSFHAGNHGLPAFLAAAGAPVWMLRAVPLAILAVAAAAMLRREADARVSVAVALLLLPLVSRHAWEHHYVVALPAMTLLLAAWPTRSRRRLIVIGAWIVLAAPTLLILLQSGGPDWHPEAAWSAGERLLYHAPKPLTSLMLLIACVVPVQSKV